MRDRISASFLVVRIFFLLCLEVPDEESVCPLVLALSNFCFRDPFLGWGPRFFFSSTRLLTIPFLPFPGSPMSSSSSKCVPEDLRHSPRIAFFFPHVHAFHFSLASVSPPPRLDSSLFFDDSPRKTVLPPLPLSGSGMLSLVPPSAFPALPAQSSLLR